MQGRLASSDLRRIKPGAKVVRLDAVRLNTGDVVARSLAVENIATALPRSGSGPASA